MFFALLFLLSMSTWITQAMNFDSFRITNWWRNRNYGTQKSIYLLCQIEVIGQRFAKHHEKTQCSWMSSELRAGNGFRKCKDMLKEGLSPLSSRKFPLALQDVAGSLLGHFSSFLCHPSLFMKERAIGRASSWGSLSPREARWEKTFEE